MYLFISSELVDYFHQKMFECSSDILTSPVPLALAAEDLRFLGRVVLSTSPCLLCLLLVWIPGVDPLIKQLVFTKLINPQHPLLESHGAVTAVIACVIQKWT